MEGKKRKRLCTRWYVRCVLWRDILIIIIHGMKQSGREKEREKTFQRFSFCTHSINKSHAFHPIWFKCGDENCIVAFASALPFDEPLHCPLARMLAGWLAFSVFDLNTSIFAFHAFARRVRFFLSFSHSFAVVAAPLFHACDRSVSVCQEWRCKWLWN